MKKHSKQILELEFLFFSFKYQLIIHLIISGELRNIS